MSTNREIPELRIVPNDSLVLHEECEDNRVENLVRRLQEDGILKNPPIVAPLYHSGRYVVLDGANRVLALREIGVRDTLVQVVDYHRPELELDTWNHLVAGWDEGDFLGAIREIDGLTVDHAGNERARGVLLKPKVLSVIICPHGGSYAVHGQGELKTDAELLRKLVDVYHGNGEIYRVKTDDIAPLLDYYDDVTALAVFPQFRPADIMELARNSAKLPTGVTRHLIPERALRVNIDLSRLRSEVTVKEKNAWLEEWIRRRLAQKRIRYYEESTFLFDE